MHSRTQRLRIEDEVAANAPPPSGPRHIEMADTALPGLRLRIRPAGADGTPGARTWLYCYRPKGGKTRTYTLGRFPEIKTEEARALAGGLRLDVRRGGDPQAKLSAARGRTDGQSLRGLLKAYREHRTMADSTRALHRTFDRKLSTLLDRPVASISKREVSELLGSMTLVMRNRVLAHVRAAFRWGLENDRITSDPTAGIKRQREQPRQRKLSETDIAALLDVLRTESSRVRLGVKLMLLTAQRVSEVLGIRWEELQPVHVEDDAGVGEWALNWNLPGPRRKTGEDMVVPLSPAVLRLICHETGHPLDALDGPSLPGSDHVIGLAIRARTQWVQRVIKATVARGVEPWQLRDLRRTAASRLARLGYSDELIGLILGHARQSVTGRHYQQDTRIEERRNALAHWALRVEQLDPANDPFAVTVPKP